MQTKYVFVAVFVTCLWASGCAHAPESPAPSTVSFQGMNADPDSRVDQEEFDTAVSSWFGHYDSDRDGAIDSGKKKELPAWLAQADKDGDGKIDVIEYMDAGSAQFKNADTNKDGKLSAEEFKAVQLTTEIKQ